ncbi:MAG: hypothetical protein SFV23_09435 [Planctomycetaceae bacterium]|nr:hypothetical protein [Planctomycetaceae bacterium]
MLATGITTLSCGMTVCIAVWTGESQAQQLVVDQTYKFGGWTVTVSPATQLPARVVQTPANASMQIVPAGFTQVEETPAAEAVVAAEPAAATAADDLPPTPAAPTDSETAPCAVTPAEALGRVNLYREVYDSIPFSRAEYDANPSYRHDATMEFLFGQMRPTEIQRGTTKVEVELNSPPVAFDPLIYNRYGVRRHYYPFYPFSSTFGHAYLPR